MLPPEWPHACRGTTVSRSSRRARCSRPPNSAIARMIVRTPVAARDPTPRLIAPPPGTAAGRWCDRSSICGARRIGRSGDRHRTGMRVERGAKHSDRSPKCRQEPQTRGRWSWKQPSARNRGRASAGTTSPARKTLRYCGGPHLSHLGPGDL